MRWLRRGVLIRLAIYIPVLTYLGWRAAGGCQGDQAAEPAATDQAESPDPRRRVITMPDGSKQEILELTREEAEQIIGGPIPEPSKAEADAKPADAKPADAKPADAKPADAKPADAKAAPDPAD